jgi:tetratricopeptide (TPR) repeat protein
MNFVGLGVAHLILGDHAAVCSLFDRLNDEHPRRVATYYEFAGLARWLSGRRAEAAADWHAGVSCGYTDGSGGVGTALLLYFAAVRYKRAFPFDEATKVLQQTLQRPASKNFPGNIGRYMLGEISAAEMRQGCTYGGQRATVECNLTADFYSGVLLLREGKRREFQRAMRDYARRKEEIDPDGKEWDILFHLAQREAC